MFQTFQNWIRGSTDGSKNRKKLDGRVAAITGATSGIGKAVAEDLGSNHLLSFDGNLYDYEVAKYKTFAIILSDICLQ